MVNNIMTDREMGVAAVRNDYGLFLYPLNVRITSHLPSGDILKFSEDKFFINPEAKLLCPQIENHIL